MDAYPSGLSPHPPQEGLSTPTHGGIVAGPEYDVPIAPKPLAAPSPSLTPTPSTTSPDTSMDRPAHARAPSAAQQRPRPVSMPPQASYAPPAGTADRDSRYDDGRHARDAPKARSGTRILGDYTLSKTLGAGSMGKVKLAHHNITGEKVRFSFRCVFRTSSVPEFWGLFHGHIAWVEEMDGFCRVGSPPLLSPRRLVFVLPSTRRERATSPFFSHFLRVVRVGPWSAF